jgi:hypothetical protein
MSGPMRDFVVFGFGSVHDTLAAEAALKAAGVAAVTVPSPREVGEVCGIAIRVEPQDAEAAAEALATSGNPPRARAMFKDL